jgi:LacI family transcriptional regulator
VLALFELISAGMQGCFPGGLFPLVNKHTIGDIARKADVSTATVSRVLNNKRYVDPATRERVLRVVEEAGFVPNAIAANLASGRSRFLGILVPSFAWSFIPDIMNGVSAAIANTPYELLLYTIDGIKQEHSQRGDLINRVLFPKITAGLLAIFPGEWTEQIVRLHTKGEFPVVMINDQVKPPAIPWVGADNWGGAYSAVRLLIALGHQRIGHIQGPKDYFCSLQRHEGYCQAMVEAGLTVDPACVLEGNFGPDGGEVAARKLFALPPEQRPTAIFCASDGMSYGVITAAEQCGLCIPDDVALVGFDDLAPSQYVRPALTTVKQPFREMGQNAIEILASLIDQGQDSLVSSARTQHQERKEDAAQLHIQLETQLIVRVSCGSA